MAESMRGMKRSHRCTEVSAANIGRDRHRHGMGTEKKESGKSDLYRFERPFRDPSDRV